MAESKVLEVGGANSRVLPALMANNEKWNLDEFKGSGNGPTIINAMEDVKLVRHNLGEFSSELPDSYFDIVFSISVIEHVPDELHDNFWRDHARILKPGGLGIHAVDLYVGDNLSSRLEEKIDRYLHIPRKYGLTMVEQPALERPVVFRCDMAANSDWGMWRWN